MNTYEVTIVRDLSISSVVVYPNGIYRGIKGCDNSFISSPVKYKDLLLISCSRQNTDSNYGSTDSYFYQLMVYNQTINKLQSNQSEVETYFPIVTIKPNILATNFSFFFYQDINSWNHIVVTNSLFQFVDYLLADQLFIIAENSSYFPIDTDLSLNLSLENKYYDEEVKINVIRHGSSQIVSLDMLPFLLIFIFSIIVIILYLIKHYIRKDKLQISPPVNSEYKIFEEENKKARFNYGFD
jgi:hypothetical protein